MSDDLTLPLAGSKISLRLIDDTTLGDLLAIAIAEATPEEVMPPVPGPPGWNDARQAAFLAFHKERRSGLTGPHAEVYFAIVDGSRIVGSARLKRSDPCTFETGMWLARCARGRGIGSKTLLALRQRAAAEGATRVVARTSRGNTAAIGALRNSGAEIGEPDEHGRICAEIQL